VALNGILNFFLVPLMGGVGACLSTLTATGGLFAVLMICVYQYLPGLSFRQTALEPCAAASILFFALFLLKPFDLLLSLVVGTLLYAAMMAGSAFLFSKSHLNAFRESIRRI
ncbi:MAG: polysaccharide biosynthesis C-terminal domain-containing protein, partial [Desulfobacteraceae bacterium]